MRCQREEPKSIADRQTEEPVVVQRDVFRGARVTHRLYPHQYARVIVARSTKNAYAMEPK